jgi:hypothetical protein
MLHFVQKHLRLLMNLLNQMSLNFLMYYLPLKLLLNQKYPNYLLNHLCLKYLKFY